MGFYLWCEKLWCATEGTSSVTITHPLLAEPKVCNLDVAFRVEEQVIQLEVPEGEQGVSQGHFDMRNMRDLMRVAFSDAR